MRSLVLSTRIVNVGMALLSVDILDGKAYPIFVNPTNKPYCLTEDEAMGNTPKVMPVDEKYPVYYEVPLYSDHPGDEGVVNYICPRNEHGE